VFGINVSKLVSIIGVAAVAFGFGVGAANATLISKSNSTFGGIDGTSINRDFVFSEGDFSDSSIVTKVTIEIDFSKCGQLGGPGGCTDFSEFLSPGAVESEMGFALISPDGTSVALVENSGGNESFETGSFDTFINGGINLVHIVILFEDETTELGNRPASGTFSPEGFLSSFNGKDAVGTWSLFLEDDAPGDPLVFHEATLNITVLDDTVPEPGTLALFGVSIIGLAVIRRRRWNQTVH
jgi:hypothetical protein